MEYSTTTNMSPSGTNGRLKLSLKKVVPPFFGMKPQLPVANAVLGSEDLISCFELSGAFQRFCGVRKPKEELASFLTNVCGTSNLRKQQDASWYVASAFVYFWLSSLKHLVEKPPITGKDITPLSTTALVGFKLTAGPVPDAYRFFDTLPGDSAIFSGYNDGLPSSSTTENGDKQQDRSNRKRIKRSLDDFEEPVEKKSKKHRTGEEKEKKQKKKKKDKKKKKNDDDGKRVKETKEQQPFY